MKEQSIIFYNYGDNVQILPNATTAVQYNCMSAEAKAASLQQKEKKKRLIDAALQVADPVPPVVSTPGSLLAPYLHDASVRTAFAERIAASPNAQTLCNAVLVDLYNDYLRDATDAVRLVKSKSFIQNILSLCTFKEGRSVSNLRHYIRKYVLGEIR